MGLRPANHPRAGPRPEPPPLATSPRSAFTVLGRGPPLSRFRFRFPAAVVEENESDRGGGPDSRSCSVERGARRAAAVGVEPANWGRCPHQTRWQHALDFSALQAVPRLDRRETRKWTPSCHLQCARVCSLLEEDNNKLPIVDESMPEVAIAGMDASNHKERKEHS
ncbi:uncharacterized protein LOC123938779 isoform X4 [Meles meles]|uniref:uncharacterized protein LOC123938779 isoform X4 n=1 Tax=Meles meles TaxID=9662 RepID=UPI001E69B644|nr:uncharacterized protein LOC123938779 isoform X4 [Meles meles]